MNLQKIKFLLHRILPPGTSLQSILTLYGLSLALSLINNMLFLVKYASARARLYAVIDGVKILRKGAVIPTFAELTENCSLGVLLMAVVALYLLIQNYLSFYQGSRSIYLMRRLPDRWDLLRRTAVFPLLSFLFAVLLLFALWSVYVLIYVSLTPAQCLPAGQSFHFLHSIL